MGNLVTQILYSEVTATKVAIIDCDADPFVPHDCKVYRHTKGGRLRFDPAIAQFYVADCRENGGMSTEGNELRKLLADKPVLNANVLDHLLANPHLIPENWKTDERGEPRCIGFWGTTYERSDGRLCVRDLCCDGENWVSNLNCLDGSFNRYDHAVLYEPEGLVS